MKEQGGIREGVVWPIRERIAALRCAMIVSRAAFLFGAGHGLSA
jgi:hypothetical protein